MSLGQRWKRVDAQGPGHWLLCMPTLLPVLVTVWLTAAWGKGRPWARWVATVLSGMRLAGNVLGGFEVSWLGSAFLVFDRVLLAYLFHPACCARILSSAAPVGGRHDQGWSWSERRCRMIVVITKRRGVAR